jgi:hypothetical protein
VTDLQNAPAVAPEDEGGNERAGLRVAGALAILVGWGLGVFLNVLLHLSAHSGGRVVGWVRIYPAFGPYAWAVLLLGAFTGVFGAAMIWVSQFAKPGPLHLPGTSY